MNGNGRNWKPSPRELHLLWYLRLTTRYLVGVGGLVYAMATNHLNPVLLLILGAIATSTDVLVFARDLFKAALEDARSLEQGHPEEEPNSPRGLEP